MLNVGSKIQVSHIGHIDEDLYHLLRRRFVLAGPSWSIVWVLGMLLVRGCNIFCRWEVATCGELAHSNSNTPLSSVNPRHSNAGASHKSPLYCGYSLAHHSFQKHCLSRLQPSSGSMPHFGSLVPHFYAQSVLPCLILRRKRYLLSLPYGLSTPVSIFQSKSLAPLNPPPPLPRFASPSTSHPSAPKITTCERPSPPVPQRILDRVRIRNAQSWPPWSQLRSRKPRSN